MAKEHSTRESNGPQKEGLDRDKALQIALGQIEKQFGKGAVMKMGEKTTLGIESIPTGALALDLAVHRPEPAELAAAAASVALGEAGGAPR